MNQSSKINIWHQSGAHWKLINSLESAKIANSRFFALLFNGRPVEF